MKKLNFHSRFCLCLGILCSHIKFRPFLFKFLFPRESCICLGNCLCSPFQALSFYSCPRKTIQNTPFQQHTIFSNTEMLWIVFCFCFFVYFFYSNFFFSIEKLVILRVKYFYPLSLHLQKCDTPKFIKIVYI